jgi:dihydrofolate reductase
VEAALARARAAVQEGSTGSTGAGGEKDVVVSGTTIVQQCLRGGWLDEINIHLAPVLLGGGVRLFDHLGLEPRKLEILRVVDTPEVTHLRYRVVK